MGKRPFSVFQAGKLRETNRFKGQEDLVVVCREVDSDSVALADEERQQTWCLMSYELLASVF